jgi:FkbM family methyltransferase
VSLELSPQQIDELRELRAERVKVVRDLDAAGARELYAGAWGEEHRMLAHCGLRDLQREGDEEAIAADLIRALERPGDPQPGVLLAAMLMLRGFELPLPENFERIPGWLLPDYGRFLLAAPRIFNHPGEADRYGRFAQQAVGLLHRHIAARPLHPDSLAMADVFVEASSFTQVYFNELNLRELYRQRAEILERRLLARGAPLANAFASSAAPRTRKIRVGVLCDHYYSHTETYFMLAHLEHFPRERCTLTLYSLSSSPDPLEGYAKGIADAAVMLPTDDAAAVARLRADDLDVLIIGSNVTIAATRWALLASFRLARVQVIAGSSPVTSGMTSADWYVSAQDNETEAGAREHFTEQVYRMPGMITHYAYYLDREPPTLSTSREELGLAEGEPVFFSGANFFKVTPELSASWARLLAEVPNAWLVMMPFNQNWNASYLTSPFTSRVLEQVDAAGGDASRVLILDPVPTRADLHRVMALADVYLDSFPFAGACSLLDPLLLGLPLVARTGSTFRSGIAAGMLRGLGLGDLAVDGEAAYVKRAVELACDAGQRERIRVRIRAALSPRNPVYDSETASRHFEAALVDMVEQADARDAALLRTPPSALRAALERLAGHLAETGNAWFAALADLELIRALVVPYLRSLPGRLEDRRMIDIGACVGQAAGLVLGAGARAELIEPDPACSDALAVVSAEHAGRARVHRLAISDREQPAIAFHQSEQGLSGLSASPYAPTRATLMVPVTRLDRFCRDQAIERADFLKIDAEGWDFEALASHDLAACPLGLAMAEFCTEFARQDSQKIASAIAAMRAAGYEALVFSYEDHGNFKRRVWKHELIAARFGAPVARADGHTAGNILFFREDDTLFLATAMRLFLSFLPPKERTAFLP